MKQGWAWWGAAALLLCLWMNSAAAQQQPHVPQPVAQGGPQVDASADALIDAARRAAQLIDDDRAVDAWNAAAPFMFARIGSDRFASGVRDARKAFAKTSLRTWAGVKRVRYERDVEVPAGLYGNVDFSTQLVDGSTMFELVTMRLERDGVWRLTGYVPRRNQ